MGTAVLRNNAADGDSATAANAAVAFEDDTRNFGCGRNGAVAEGDGGSAGVATANTCDAVTDCGKVRRIASACGIGACGRHRATRESDGRSARVACTDIGNGNTGDDTSGKIGCGNCIYDGTTTADCDRRRHRVNGGAAVNREGGGFDAHGQRGYDSRASTTREGQSRCCAATRGLGDPSDAASDGGSGTGIHKSAVTTKPRSIESNYLDYCLSAQIQGARAGHFGSIVGVRCHNPTAPPKCG